MIKRTLLAVALPIAAAFPFNPALAEQTIVAFSPDANALDLILRTINDAQKSIEISAYVYTSAPVTKALITARKRGVVVRLVMDMKGSNSRSARAALNALSLAGVQVRLNHNYAVHHDKFLIVDKKTVQTGSFNYTQTAATKNSENVVVIKDNPAIARAFYSHWLSRYDSGEPYVADLSGKFHDDAR